MKNCFTLLLCLVFALMAETKTVVVGGFTTADANDSLSNVFFMKYITDNLVSQKVEIDLNRSIELNYLYNKHNNLFLAAREMVENMALQKNVKINKAMKADPAAMKSLGLPDYLVYGQLKYYGKRVDLVLEIYSMSKNSTSYKNAMEGRTAALLDFYQKTTEVIMIETGSLLKPVNPLGITDNGDFADYLRYLTYQKKNQYEKIFDELEAAPQLVQKYPQFQTIFDEARTKTDFSTPSIFGNIIVKNVPDTLTATNPTELWTKNLIYRGYKLKHKTDIVNESKDDSANVNIMVHYDIQLKKSHADMLDREIKKRKGDSRFANMGRYFFTANEQDGEIFKETLLKQKLVFKTFSEDSTELFKSELAISRMTFEGGGYRNTGSQPFPVTPMGPADNAFSLKKKTDGVFIFEDIPKVQFKKVKYAVLEIVFE